MIETIKEWASTPWIAVTMYWIPAAICATGYTLRTFANYRKDVAERAKEGNYYAPTDTIGDLIGRAVISALPICNLWAAVFDLCPEIFEGILKRMSQLFSQPLVPRKEKKP